METFKSISKCQTKLFLMTNQDKLQSFLLQQNIFMFMKL